MWARLTRELAENEIAPRGEIWLGHVSPSNGHPLLGIFSTFEVFSTHPLLPLRVATCDLAIATAS